MIRLRFAVVAVALVLTGARAAAAQELVVNGGFETVTGAFPFPDWPSADWTMTDGCFGGVGANHKVTGDYGAYLGNGCTIGQTLATTAGQSYTFAFWVRLAVGQSISAKWNNQVFAADTITTGFTRLSTVVTAVGTQSTIAFTSTTPAYTSLSIDDISVQGTSTTVPEPSTMALTGVGVLCLAGVARRRSRRA